MTTLVAAQAGRSPPVPRHAIAGGAVRLLRDFTLPAEWTLDGPNLTAALHASDHVMQALHEMHRHNGLNLIVFPDRGGLGFRTIQAKQTGQAFLDVRLGVAVFGTTAEQLRHRQQWLYDWRHLALDHAERYSLAHADVHFATDCESFMERTGRIAPVTGLPPSPPLVSVCVPYFNLGNYLEETLASVAAQTYPNLEVIVINDGSTDAESAAVFQRMRTTYPQFRYLEQANAGIGATRNRGLHESRGRYFLPVDADNILRPDMVERLVRGLEANAAIAALSCYFLAFSDVAKAGASCPARSITYAVKPTGGPRVLGCWQNVYGDASALFRTETLRSIGGFTTDRDTSFEDWETFVRLVNAGFRVDVVPDFLFYYRHREDGFSRTTNGFRNLQRVLRRFAEIERLPAEERRLLWDWLVGSQQRLAELEGQLLATSAPASRLSARVRRALGRWLLRCRRPSAQAAGSTV
ncbi:MAG: glycosyltransferase family 2 protein, partial [Gemmataceae bacterium]|nr:glycosyltransferase family 2 protein [Gemmataceae bacterium]